jgi:hypothetical protein
MASWYYTVSSDLSKIPDCITFFEHEFEDARKEISMRKQTIEQNGAMLPGVVEFRFNQLQEIEAILEFLNIKLRKLRADKFKKYLEAYNKQLSSRDAEKYIDGEEEVVDMSLLINEFALIRNKFLGIIKGLDQKSWQLGHITRLRVAGLDDARID